MLIRHGGGRKKVHQRRKWQNKQVITLAGEPVKRKTTVMAVELATRQTAAAGVGAEAGVEASLPNERPSNREFRFSVKMSFLMEGRRASMANCSLSSNVLLNLTLPPTAVNTTPPELCVPQHDESRSVTRQITRPKIDDTRPRRRWQIGGFQINLNIEALRCMLMEKANCFRNTLANKGNINFTALNAYRTLHKLQ